MRENPRLSTLFHWTLAVDTSRFLLSTWVRAGMTMMGIVLLVVSDFPFLLHRLATITEQFSHQANIHIGSAAQYLLHTHIEPVSRRGTRSDKAIKIEWVWDGRFKTVVKIDNDDGWTSTSGLASYRLSSGLTRRPDPTYDIIISWPLFSRYRRLRAR